MKNITLLLLILFTTSLSAQLKVLEKPDKVDVGSTLNFYLEKYNDDTYVFTYRNQRYPAIYEYDSFQIVETGNDIETLYKILNNALIDRNTEGIRLEVGNSDKLSIVHTSKLTMNGGVIIYHYSNGLEVGHTIAMNSKELDKLFGKKVRSFRKAKNDYMPLNRK